MNTVESFKSCVTRHGGEARVLDITFNNSYRKTFSVKEPFSFAEHLDEVNAEFVLPERDIMGNPYKVVKPVEFVEAIIFATTDEDIQNIDRRYISS